MALKDTLKNIFNYFEIDERQEYEDQEEVIGEEGQTMRVAPQPTRDLSSETRKKVAHPPLTSVTDNKSNLQRLNERQKELSIEGGLSTERTIIDIKYPKRYEDAPEIVNLLVGNASVLIDFQFMSENQARRCLDYLDGARSVLAGNLKKVSGTMWLLTPVNVTVNIEELRSSKAGFEDTQFDFDMRR